MRKLFIQLSAALIASASVMAVTAASAAELKAGDVISAANFDQIQNDTFEGHKVSDLITDKVGILIKQFGLKMTLRNSEKIDIPTKEDIANTAKYSKDVKIDPTTHEVTGYIAGRPFPDLSIDDPLAGYKALWNKYYQDTYGLTFSGHYSFLFINVKTGLDRVQRWYNTSFKMKGRQTGDPVLGTDNLVKKQILFAVEPYDIRGIGVFTLRYDSPKLEDNWAYVKSVRRTRQLSGSSWMDNLAGSVQLNDEYDGFSGRPSWYPAAKLVEKRWILAVAHLPKILVNSSASDNASKYPTLDLATSPYCWPTSAVGWEPREVWKIEVTMPPEHPYSKRVYYEEVQFPRIYQVEHYDKSGEFAKNSFVFSTPRIGGDGIVAMLPDQGTAFDIKREAAWVYLGEPDNTPDDPKITENDVTLGKLAAGGN
jgi:hypothetical protein